MISKHCGEPLAYQYGRFTDPKLGFHAWKCLCCGKRFKQRTRKPLTTAR